MRDIPQWMKHMPAAADAMTFVDMVFPAFLFIVGMSVPFALQNRLQKGDSLLQLQGHIAWRTLGLLALGFFLVNAEEGLNAKATGISQHTWLLLFYISAILTWNVYTFKTTRWQYVFRITGVAGMAILAFIYRSGENGTVTMHPHWWGILGLIGWAYLFTCIFYQLLKGNILLLAGAIALCTFLYILFKQPLLQSSDYFGWLSTQSGHAAHTSIALCGVVLSRIFFNGTKTSSNTVRFTQAAFFASLLFTAGYLLRPYYKISKINATPTWCLYSAAACCIIFGLLYWIVDIKGKSNWIRFFKPAATNPLLTYIIPGILFSFFSLTGITLFPQQFRFGVPGILWSLFFAVAVMWIARGLNKLKIRMQL